MTFLPQLNTKGQLNNYFSIIVFLFAFGIATLIAMTLMLGMKTAWVDAGYYTGQIQTTGEEFIGALQIFDTAAVFFLVALLIALGLTSFKLNTAPAFFIVTLAMGAFMGFVSYIFNYIFAEYISNSSISAAQVYFPKLIAICTNLHWVSLAAIVIGSLTLYAKRPAEGGNLIS